MQSNCRLLLVLVISLLNLFSDSTYLFAQEDTEFWFAAPRMLSGHNKKKGATYQLIIFNHSASDAHVTISQPANTAAGKISKTETVNANSGKVIPLASSSQVYPEPDSVSVPFDVVSKRGLYITSDVSVQCYFQVTKGNGEAYTLKGQNALGTEFVVAMQNKFENGRGGTDNMYDNSYSSVSIVASEDNTSVTIKPSKSVSKNCNTSDINITLNRGETYAFHACGEKGSNHPIGTVITATKPIAVTYNDDCLMSGKSSDAVGEQLTATILAGDQYVAVSNKTSNDYLFLVGLSDGTTVTDETGKSYSLNKGSVEQISLESKAAIYLKGSSPFEVFQVTSHKGKNGNEMGGTILPQISCTGSTNASYHRVNSNVILNLVTHKDNISALSVNGQPISSSDFQKIGSSDFYYFSADLKDKYGITDSDIRVVSTSGVFQMGALDYKSGETATFGFFSNYASSAVVTINDETTNRYTICRGYPLHVVVTPVDKSIKLENAEVEWRDLLDGGKVRTDLKTDVLDIPTVDFDSAAFQVVWKNACGISSFVNLMISVKDSYHSEETQIGCGSYIWPVNGKTYTESGEYTHVLTTEYGCADTHVLHLTIKKPNVVNDYVTASKNYTWPRNGKLITGSSDTYSEYDGDGCETTRYNLHMNYIGVQTADNYSWRGHTYSESGTYTDPSETLSDGTVNNYTLILELIKPTQRPFSTGECGITVTFAQGNLQYQASTNTWRFADNQWDIIGASNKDISETYTGWIDLFGWATGDNPTNTSPDNSTYGSGLDDLTETKYDWGSNTISNGGGAEWHSLSYKEWKYILTDRSDAKKKYGCATVNSVKGIVLLPDDWELPSGLNFKPSLKDYSSNIYTADQWTVMQAAGAVFLPATGTRYPSGSINKVNNTGYYWTSTAIGKEKAWDFYFDKDTIKYFQGTRGYGDGVRLVKYVNSVPHVGIGEFWKETCDGSYTWNGVKYTESGDYQQILLNNGCDSVVTLHLKVGQSYLVDTVAVECDEFTWHGTTYKESKKGIPYVAKTALGCDSVVMLNLTINKSVVEEPKVVKACDSYYWAEADMEYTESGIYTFVTTTAQGCSRTLTLDLTINESKEVYLDPVEACDSYEWEGKTYTESGLYYRDYQTEHGCDSTIYLDLTIHPSYKATVDTIVCDSFTWHGKKFYFDEVNPLNNLRPSLYSGHTIFGCDSVITYNFKICKSYKIDSIANECEQYTWRGITYTTSGEYTYTTQTVDGCDSTVVLHLNILPKRDTTLQVTLCPGYSYQVKDKFGSREPVIFKTAGLHSAVVDSHDGCDSIVNIDLSFYSNDPVHVYDTICDGETYYRNEFSYKEAGEYTVKLLNEHGCEYDEILHLAVNPTYKTNMFDTICDNEVYEWEGTTYTKTTIDTKTLKTIHGCDSMVTLYLQVWPTKTNIDELVLCEGESFIWGDYSIESVKPSDSKTYSYTFQTTHGCDSVVALKLIVNNKFEVTFDDQICDNDVYYWQGSSYSFNGSRNITDTKTLNSTHGCDSIVTMRLHFNETKQTSFNATICDNEVYEWNGTSYNKPGNHSQMLKTTLGCDSLVTLNLTVNPTYNVEWSDTILEGGQLTWQGTTYEVAGDYTKTLSTRVHCDSIVTLHLATNALEISDIGYSEFCVERDSAGLFTLQVPRGYITSARMRFSDAAHRQGIKDTTVIIEGNNQPINVVVPMAARAGIYDLTVEYYFRNKLTYTQEIHFSVLYPSMVLLQKWNDFIGAQTSKYNGGYTFVAFEWFKNGEPLGETGSYLYQPLEIGAAYTALLTDNNGVQLFTCPLYAVDKDDIGLYPTVVNPNHKMRVHVTKPATMITYDAIGKQVSTQTFESGETDFIAPQQKGLYIMHIMLEDKETDRSYKVLVQ